MWHYNISKQGERRQRGYCRVIISTYNGDEEDDTARRKVDTNQKDDVVKISLTLSRPLKVKAGQYMNLLIPAVSFWSFAQSHSFVVAS